jgi:hypothetical protein
LLWFDLFILKIKNYFHQNLIFIALVITKNCAFEVDTLYCHNSSTPSTSILYNSFSNTN